MTGYIQQLEARYGEVFDDRARRYMHHIVEASQRMRSLIDDLLEYSRFLRAPQAGQQVDAGAVLARVTRSLGPMLVAAEGTVDADTDRLPSLWTDPGHLESLLQNLIANAIKFAHADRPPRVAVSATEADGWATIVVDDNGIGIEPDYRDRVFKMFQRLHVREAYPGTGIGLAIARQVVEQHGGRIWVEDSPLGGARFCFTMPTTPPPTTPPEETADANIDP
jgi:signal transduction histidine kinase